MCKLYFGTVIYPNALLFADDFFLCLERQTYKNFTLLLINDGVDSKILDNILRKYDLSFEIISYSEKMTPQRLRVKLLEEAKKNEADYLILGDIDDFFSDNRVRMTYDLLKQNPNVGFAYNDLLLFDGARAMSELPRETVGIKNIIEFNYLGLTNTAISMKYISWDILNSLAECRSQVFDWFLFSILLINNVIGMYVPDAFTYYRLYENNFIGISQKSTPLLIEKELHVKIEHYKSLSIYSNECKELYNLFVSGSYEVNADPSLFWWNYLRGKIS